MGGGALQATSLPSPRKPGQSLGWPPTVLRGAPLWSSVQTAGGPHESGPGSSLHPPPPITFSS